METRLGLALRATGSSPGVGAAEGPLGGRFRCGDRPVRSGRGRGWLPRGGFARPSRVTGCSGARRAAGARPPCAAAQLRARHSPLPRGSPRALPESPNRERSSTSDKAFPLPPTSGWKPLSAVGESTPPASGWRRTPSPPPQEVSPLSRSSAAPPDQPPGTSPFLAPGVGEVGREGVPCFE